MAEQAIVETPSNVARLVRYPITPAEIRALKARTVGLSADTREGYEAVRRGIAECRTARGAIEDRRQELNSDALAWTREVNSTAKDLTEAVREIETLLKEKKQTVDDARAKAKREKEEAEKRAVEERLRAEQAVADAIARSQREAEEARLAEERRQLDADRAKLDEQRRNAEAEEARRREELAAAQRKLDADKADLARAQAAQRARDEAEAQRVAELERQKAEAARVERIRPDVDRVRDYAAALRGVPRPDVESVDAREFLDGISLGLGTLCDAIEAFGKPAAAEAAK